MPFDSSELGRRHSGPAPRLDPASAQAVRRFVVMLVTIVVWAGICWKRLPEHGVAAMMGIAAASTSVLALLLRERFNGPTLNRWDEAFAFFAVYCLMRAIS
jgi:hypothetical protein